VFCIKKIEDLRLRILDLRGFANANAAAGGKGKGKIPTQN